jgi:hypothetical protein
MLHSAAATCLAFVNAHVGRCLAVLCSVMALKWAWPAYSSPSMQVSSSPLNPSRHPLTQEQHFSYWSPSALARICLAGFHPVPLAILLFHPQLLQVTPCLVGFCSSVLNRWCVPLRFQVASVADMGILVLGYIFFQGGLLFMAMSFACESSVTVSTTGSIVMNLNLDEHRNRVLVQTSESRRYRLRYDDDGHEGDAALRAW